MRPVVSIAIQHHPNRAHLLPRILTALDGYPATVVTDPDPDGPRSTMRTAWQAWSALEDDATHHLVITDDMLLCDSFVRLVHEAVTERPDAIISFATFGHYRPFAEPIRRARLRRAAWAELPRAGWYPLLCTAMPTQLVLAWLAWEPKEPEPHVDDVQFGLWVNRYQHQVLATVPCLAEHDDQGESVLGLRPHTRQPKHRVVAWYAQHPGRIDWQRR